MVEIISCMSMRAYREAEGVSQSTLKKCLKSTAHLSVDFKPTQAMELGTAVHCDLLTPDELDYAIAPQVNKRTNAGKVEWASFCELNANKSIITAEQAVTKDLMVNSVRSHSGAMEILNAMGDAEVSAFGMINALKVKGRADGIITGNAIVDLKTTADASPEGFSKSCAKFGYHIQASMYQRLFGLDKFVFIVVESVEPYITEVYILDDRSLELGHKELDLCVERYKKYQANEVATGYTGASELTELSLPNYYFYGKED